jgi:hypothetical protein
MRQLGVEEMTPSDATELAMVLTSIQNADLSEAIARESRGNLFLIVELVLSGEKFGESRKTY